MFTAHDGVEGLYMRVCMRGCGSQLWAALTGRPCHLLPLAALDAAPAGGAVVGVQTVAIAQICGSEGRHQDFDRAFHPLKSHGQERWMRVAEAQRRGVALPAVELIQVGARYVVRDGHHRISVARALGQRAIEAKVVVWAARAPAAAEQPAPSRRPARWLEQLITLGRRVAGSAGASSAGSAAPASPTPAC